MSKNIKLPLERSYPKKIHFGAETYSIVFKKGLDCYGEADPEKKEIRIKSGLSPRELLATFIHELLHIIEFEAPIKIKHKTVHQLEDALLKMLMDNFL